MALQIGIVGLPNVGKSTLFKALTKSQVEASNYPFCTIDPNVGVVPVPDERLDQLTQFSGSAETISAVVEFVDIAGLVAGAHKGEGLGNKFLANIREVDAIAHVVRDFTDSDITHVHGTVDAQADSEVINLELVMADLELVQKHLQKVEKKARGMDKAAIQEKAVLEKIVPVLEAGKLANTLELDPEKEAPFVQQLNLLTSKPILYVVNIDEGVDAAQAVQNMQGALGSEHVIAISAKIEAELAELDAVDAQEMMQDLGMQDTGLHTLITAGYRLLNLISYFTTGEKETRAWTVQHGALAPEAAGVIHTDFQEKFIRAEVIATDKLLAATSWSDARDNGWIRTEGKNYPVQDGDVMVFHHA